MMMTEAEATDSMEYAIQQVDNQLADLMPALGRRACTPRVMEEADRLLDTRNYLMDIMREIAYDDLERMMTNGD